MCKFLKISVLLFLFTSCSSYEFEKINYHFLNQFESGANDIVNYLLVDLDQVTMVNSVENVLLYQSLLKVFFFVMLIAVTLFIISVPVILFYFWFITLFNFKYALNSSFKSNYWSNQYKLVEPQKQSETERSKYRRIYGNLVGFGFGFIIWLLSSFIYISTNFNEIKVGLKEYFQFPFKVYDSLVSNENILLDTEISSEIWIAMLSVVFISIAAYFLGKFIRNILANLELKRLPQVS